MALLAVPHHFLLTLPCNKCFLHDFMGIKGRKVCFICKAGSSWWDMRWFVWTLPAPPSLPLFSLLSLFISGVCLVGWCVWRAGWGRLWSLVEGRYGSISVVLLWEVCSAIINHVRSMRTWTAGSLSTVSHAVDTIKCSCKPATTGFFGGCQTQNIPGFKLKKWVFIYTSKNEYKEQQNIAKLTIK